MFIKDRKQPTELDRALADWHRALAGFDNAAPGETGILALELEAARRRYVLLLERVKLAAKTIPSEEKHA